MSETPAQQVDLTQREDIEKRWKERISAFVELHRLSSDDNMKRQNEEEWQIIMDLGYCPYCAMSTEEQLPSLNITEILQAINSDVVEEQEKGCRAARNLFCVKSSSPRDSLDVLLVPRLVSFLTTQGTSHSVRYLAAMTLTHLIIQRDSAYDEEMVKCGAFVEVALLAFSDVIELQAIAIVAMANVIGPLMNDERETFLMRIDSEVIPKVLEYLSTNPSAFHKEILAWMFLMLGRHKNPFKSLSAAEHLFPALEVLRTVRLSILCTVRALSRLSANIEEGVMRDNIGPALLDLLRSSEPSVVLPALRTLKKLTKNKDLVQAALDNRILMLLQKLINHSHPRIQREAVIVSANIAAGDTKHRQELIINDVLSDWVKQLVAGTTAVQCEVMLAVKNFACAANAEQTFSLVRHGVLKMMIKMLEDQNPYILLIAMEVISIMFKAAEERCKLPWLCQLFDDLGGVLRLEMLQVHESYFVRDVAHILYEDFFTWLKSDSLSPDSFGGF